MEIVLADDVIRLEQASSQHKADAEAMKAEFIKHGEQVIHGSALYDQMPFDQWLENTNRNHDPATVRPDWTVSTTFFAVRQADGCMLGMIDVRHALTVPFLQEYGGHIGYAVRPAQRRNGYATRMLQLALAYCRDLGISQVQLGCFADNAASVHTIRRCGGWLSEQKPFPDGTFVHVYFIDL